MRRGRFVLQTATLALCSGCACGALSSECFRAVPDAGALPRQVDEPCDAVCVGELA